MFRIKPALFSVCTLFSTLFISSIGHTQPFQVPPTSSEDPEAETQDSSRVRQSTSSVLASTSNSPYAQVRIAGDPINCAPHLIRLNDARNGRQTRLEMQELYNATPEACRWTRTRIAKSIESAPADQDERLWGIASQNNTCIDLTLYILQFPNGRYAHMASEQRRSLCANNGESAPTAGRSG